MEIYRAAERAWHPSPYPGIYYSKFFVEQLNENNRHGCMLVRAAKDALIPYICYHGKRQIFVLVGRIQVNDDELQRGDVVILDEKLAHTIKACEDSIYLTFFEGEFVDMGSEPDMVTRHNLYDGCHSGQHLYRDDL